MTNVHEVPAENMWAMPHTGTQPSDPIYYTAQKTGTNQKGGYVLPTSPSRMRLLTAAQELAMTKTERLAANVMVPSKAPMDIGVARRSVRQLFLGETYNASAQLFSSIVLPPVLPPARAQFQADLTAITPTMAWVPADDVKAVTAVLQHEYEWLCLVYTNYLCRCYTWGKIGTIGSFETMFFSHSVVVCLS